MNQFHSQFTWLFMYMIFVAVHIIPYLCQTSYYIQLHYQHVMNLPDHFITDLTDIRGNLHKNVFCRPSS